jgi:hypothetical protein
MTSIRHPFRSVPVKARTRPATAVEVAILDALRTRGELSTTGVSEAVGRSMGRCSIVLHRLESVGLVVSRSASDRSRENTTWKLWRLK